jgi:hypothetical protein
LDVFLGCYQLIEVLNVELLDLFLGLLEPKELLSL